MTEPIEPLVAALPNRRLSIVCDIAWEGIALQIGIGFNRAGRAREVFASQVKPSRALDATLADTSVLISHLLQEGRFGASALAEKLAAPADDGASNAHSLPRVLIEAAVSAETEEGDAIRTAYAQLLGDA